MNILLDAIPEGNRDHPDAPGKPDWGYEFEVQSLRFLNWKYAFGAGHYYKDEVRPLIADHEERLRADRLFFALDFFGDSDGDMHPRHDLVNVVEFSGSNDGAFFSFAPNSVVQMHDALSDLVARFERMSLMAILSESASKRHFDSPDRWIGYLKEWIALFGDARKNQAGLVGLAF